MADTVFHSFSEGISAEDVKDQYADGKLARVWEKFTGDNSERTHNYKNFLVGLLRENGCQKILDCACGTGIDSMMLVDEGFQVVSTDASDKMLKYALKARWNLRKNVKYDQWVIEEANWVTLYNDVKSLTSDPQFDAVICLGNSFAHLLDTHGDQRVQKEALENLAKCLKPGGLLLIDHRNYDQIITSGQTPSKSVFYNSKNKLDITASVLLVSGKPQLIILDYFLDHPDNPQNVVKENSEYRLLYYPHKLTDFTQMLRRTFGSKAKHEIYGDFHKLGQVKSPAYYIHVVQKLQD